MSDGPSIQNHRITISYFRTCSTCRSRSQAPLCYYTQRLISDQPEGTFERLRYFLGGDRPSQPDKEFRYLRTVIVTAAVHRGLVSELRVTSNPST